MKLFCQGKTQITVVFIHLRKYLTILYIYREIGHPNIVLLMGACTSRERICIITEYCSGGNLTDIVTSNGKYSFVQKLKWAKEIASGMASLHARNVVHHDLKPDNILIDGEGKIKICGECDQNNCVLKVINNCTFLQILDCLS